MYNQKVLDDVISLGGIGNFSATDLRKALSGKNASASPYIGSYTEGISASSTPKDLETMLQLVYLNFTAPRLDEDAFAAWKQRTINSLENYALSPDAVIGDSISATIYGHNPKADRIQIEDFENISYPRILEIQKERFANAGDFTFFFTGNINPEEVKPLIEKYIASLPSNKKREKYSLNTPNIVSGQVENRFELPMATPKTTVFNLISGDMEYTLENLILMNILQNVMNNIYTETIREQEGGTYGVGIRGSLDNIKSRFTIQYFFDTGADKRERLEKRAFEEFEKVAKEGFDSAKLSKVKEYLTKTYQDNQKENAYWSDVVLTNTVFGFDKNSNYKEVLDAITVEDVQNFASKVLSKGNRVQIIGTGIEEAK